LGLETWEMRETVGGGAATVFTQTFDADAKARLLAEAARIYDAVLDRDMDLSEVEVLVRYGSNGQLDRVALSEALLSSIEYQTRYGSLSDTGFVARLYHNTLGREPSLDELEDHLGALSGETATRAEIAAELAESAEHLVVGNGHTSTNNHDVFLMDLEKEDPLEVSFDSGPVEIEPNDADILIGTATGETLNGTGYDAIYGRDGDDTLNGAVDATALIGGGGNDTLKGNTGDDSLAGGTGDDRLEGGTGDDTYSYERGDGDDVIADTGNGPNGDTLVFGRGISVSDLSFALSGANLIISFHTEGTAEAAAAAATGLAPLTGSITIEGWTTSTKRIERIAFDDGDSHWIGHLTAFNEDTSGTGTLTGGGANEWLTGLDGDDTVNGGAGHDLINGGAGNDVLDGQGGNDTLLGGAGNDDLRGGTDDDVLDAGEGDAASGWQFLAGGTGDDRFLVARDHGKVSITELTGEGDDILSFKDLNIKDISVEAYDYSTDSDNPLGATSATEPDTLVLSWDDGSASGEVWLNDGGQHVDRITFADGSSVKSIANNLGGGFDLTGTDDDDIITGTDGNDKIIGGDGKDSVSAGAGDDEVHYALGDRFWSASGGARDVGGEGTDKLVVEAGSGFVTDGLSELGFEIFEGAELNDRVTGDLDTVDYHLDGGAGNDTLTGSGGSDTLVGGDGDDSLDAGAGVDGKEQTADGGAGNDTYIIGPDTSHLWIVEDADTALGGNDTLQFIDIRPDQLVIETINDPVKGTATQIAWGDAASGKWVRFAGTSMPVEQFRFTTTEALNSEPHVVRDLATNAIEKVGGSTALWDRGAYSEEELIGAGTFTTTVSQRGLQTGFGVSVEAANSDFNVIDYAISFRTDSRLQVVENGVSKGIFDSFQVGDEMSIERLADGSVRYLKNGDEFYTSATLSSPTEGLRADASFYHHGSRLGDTFVQSGSGERQPVNWIADPDLTIAGSVVSSMTTYEDLNGDGVFDAVLTSDDGSIWTRLGDGAGGFGEAVAQGSGLTENGIVKTGGGHGSWDRGAYSAESFTGAGVLTIINIGGAQVGFSSGANQANSGATMDYAVRVSAVGTLEIHEFGVLKGSYGRYDFADELSIERQADGTIRYLNNGEVFYTSATLSDPSVRFRADASVSHITTKVERVDLSINGGPSKAVTWVRDADLADLHPTGAVTTTFRDLNGDGIVDAILAGEDGSLRTRLGDGLGGFGDAKSQGRDLVMNTIEKAGGSAAGWDYGAYSAESFSGAGSLSTFATQTNKAFMVGLSSLPFNQNYQSIEFALFERGDGLLGVYENGVSKGVFGSYAAGDELSIERLADGTVQYLKNGAVFFTSSATSDPTVALRADVSFYHHGARIADTSLKEGSGPAKLVTWGHNVVNVVKVDVEGAVTTSYEDLNGDGVFDAVLTSDDGSIWTRLGDGTGGFDKAVAQGRDFATNSIEKTGGSTANWDRGAYSREGLLGTGKLTTVVDQTDKYTFLGLSSDPGDSGYTSIEYAIDQSHGSIYVFENGANRGSFGSYEFGDLLTIERLSDGTIQYLKNGTVFYTSTILSNSSDALYADASFYNHGSRLGETYFESIDGTVTHVNWSYDSDVALVEPDGPITTTLEDLNGDSIIDAVLDSDDGSIWTRLGDGQGGFEKTVEQGRGLAESGIVKTGGVHGSWDQGAFSKEGFIGAGALSTIVSRTNLNTMIGVSVDDQDAGYASIDYALFQRHDGLLQVYENGAIRGTFGAYHVGDELKIERLADGTIQYLKNGAVFFTSATLSSPATELHADSSFFHHGSSLGNTFIQSGAGPSEQVTWQRGTGISAVGPVVAVSKTFQDLDSDGVVDAVLASDDGSIWTRLGDGAGGFEEAKAQGRDLATNVIEKSGGVHGSWDQGAFSKEGFIGTGALTTIVSRTNLNTMIGVSVDDPDAGYTSIDYALFQRHDGLLQVYENGAVRGTFGAYHVGDELKIERLADGTIQYLKNGAVFFTSATLSSPATELHADSSFFHHGSSLGKTFMQSETGPSELVTWQYGSGVSENGVSGPVATTLQDLNGDNTVDAILTSDDGSIWTRLGDGAGGFGEANQLSGQQDDQTFNFINGTAGNDTLSGSTGAEVLAGGAGHDNLNGAGGSDILSGGTGSDTFVFTSVGETNAVVTDFDTSGASADVLQFESSVFADWNAVLTAASDDGTDTTIVLDVDFH
ncbi:Ca2+-binding RTX toxin-like protein, partial [Labrenzia sp. EL_142]|nr:Ca2+-binding RTX toxin-like protein [Labrenzia sp. EL_142]